MLERRAMWPIDILLGLLVFMGISASVSPWFNQRYSEIAPWVFGAAAVVGGIWAAFKFGPDLALAREIRAAEDQNGAAVRALMEKHAAHPEVAQELAARMLAEKQERLRATGQLPPAPTAKG